MSFRFKHFFVEDSRCAMKVGTDGVLLGRFAPMVQCSCARVLDVGTGCGLIALMIAQQALKAQIDAIEIDKAAAEQARENFQASPWPDRLQAFAVRLQDWQPEKKYDLIVSNPPYFQNSLKNPDKGREIARHTDTLSYEELLAQEPSYLEAQYYYALAYYLPIELDKFGFYLEFIENNCWHRSIYNYTSWFYFI